MEFSIIATLIATALVATVGYLTGSLGTAFSKIKSTMSTGMS